MTTENKLKVVVVGDSFTGKTSLLFSYAKGQFLSDYETTVFDNWSVTVKINYKTYLVNLFDSSGQADYEHVRCLSYPNSNVFMLCFSLIDRKTLESCRTIWIPEIRKYAGENVPIILIGTKSDLSETKTENISNEEARKTAEELGCIKFIPCSALTQKGLKCVFDETFLAGIGIKVEDDKKPCCNFL